MPKKKKLEKSTSQKAQKNIHKKVEILVALFIIAIMTFIHFYSFPTQINRTLTANVYKNGAFVDTTTVTIQGEKTNYWGGKNRHSDSFLGTFAIDCISETCIPGTIAEIVWPRGHSQQITYYKSGQYHPDKTVRNTNIHRDNAGNITFSLNESDETLVYADILNITINRNMTEFVIKQYKYHTDSYVIATSEDFLIQAVESTPHLYDEFLTENQRKTLLY